MAFLTIEPAVGLTPAQLREAIEDGPPEVALAAPHEQMLAAAGFTSIEAVDVTVEFSRTQQDWVDAWRDHEPELVDRLGAQMVPERTEERRVMRSALERGLLRRTLYSARTPR
jgi:hypothetical protein